MNNSDPRLVTPLDWPLVRRLITQRLPLDMVLALTRGAPGLEEVMLSAVPLADLGAPTLVLRNGGTDYLGQFRQRQERTVAHLTFLAPEPRGGNSYEWAQLLESMVFEAGRRGVHVISAEIDEDHPVFEAFRLAGFAVYSRQVILRHAPGTISGTRSVLLRPEAEQDSIAVSTLYLNTVPRLLQQAEPLRMPEYNGLVYERNGQIAGYLAIAEGKSGIVIKPYFHPEIYEQVPEIILSALARIGRAAHVPVYLYARSYQDWLRGILERVGFEPWAHQALMVKYTIIRAERMESIAVPGLEASRLRPPVADGPLPLPKFGPVKHKSGPGRLPLWKRNGK
ncbi:MAG: hypothetical protein HY866_10415 [Chloroflexi bacterium]|nr:hypothetical protein [Chloroflexota bacterium]